MRRFFPQASVFLLLLLTGGGVAGCRQPAAPAVVHPDPASFDGSNALVAVASFLALGPRDGGTAASAQAAHYLSTRLNELGVSTEIDAFSDRTPDGTSEFHNVVGRLPGTSPGIVVLGAHFDTKAGISGFQGANDSGSGVGVLLALAAWYRTVSAPKPTLWLAFFDGEECRREYGPHDGFHGSRRLARVIVDRGLASQVQAVVVLDMIGDRDLKVMLPQNGTSALMAAVLKAATSERCRSAFTLYPGTVLDDHQPFLDAGLPAVDLIDFEYGSAPGRNDYWHTAGDTLDKLSADSLGLVGRVVIRLLDDLAAQTASGSPSTTLAN